MQATRINVNYICPMCDGSHGSNSQCQRMTSMQHSTQTNDFVQNLIFHYAKFDQGSGSYGLKIEHLPEFELHALAATIMDSDKIYASEATGPDNPDYEKTMLPALLKYMKNPGDKDEEFEFKQTWLSGVSNYFSDQIQTLLNNACESHLHNIRNAENVYGFVNRNTGELEWRQHA